MSNFKVDRPVQAEYDSDLQSILSLVQGIQRRVGTGSTPGLAIVNPAAAGKSAAANSSTNTSTSSGNTSDSRTTNITTDSAVFGTPTRTSTGSVDVINLPAKTFAANAFLGGPATGSAAKPTARLLVPADYPVFIKSGATHAIGAVPDPGSTAGTAKFLREDATWAVPPTGTGDQVLQGRYTTSPGATLTITQSCVMECAPTANMVIILPDPSTLSYGLRITVVKDDGVTGNAFTVTVQCATSGTIQRTTTAVLISNQKLVSLIASPTQNNYIVL